MIKLSVIIPCFQEERRITQTYEDLRDFFLCSKKFKGELVFVNDGSTDSTLPMLLKISRSKFPPNMSVTILSYPLNKGKGHAVKTGLLGSRYFTKLILDADLSIGIHELNRINFRDGWRIVKGRRKFVNEPLSRRIFSWGWHQVIRFYTGLEYDTQAPMTLLRCPRSFYRNSLTLLGFCYDVQILYRAKKRHYEIQELPVEYEYKAGSKVTLKKSIRMLKDLRGL